MGKAIEVKIETFSYAGKNILENVHFAVEKGEVVAVTGLSGSGKTTLIRLMNGLIPELYGGELNGEITVLGRPVRSYATGELAKYMGNVFQDPDAQFFANEVENEIALVGENTGMEQTLLRERVEVAMRRLGITELKGRKLRALSGGQKQKVAIASTLVYDSEILILDEPTANLDFASIGELKEVLQALKAQGKTIVIAEHRLSYLKEVIDRLLLLKDGHLEKTFLPEELTARVQQENMLRCFDHTALKSTAPEVGEEVLVEVEDLLIRNREYRLEEPVSFSMNRGECMAVIGRNGIGKTTLAKELVGLLPMKNGSVSYGTSQKRRLKHTATSLQNCRNMFFYETVERELIPAKKEADKAYLEKIKEYLRFLELWEQRMQNPHDLSGGEKQRLALLITLLKASKLVILDEPTAGLDHRRMELVSSLIGKKTQETPILLITHDLELLFRTCNTAYLMSEEGHRKIAVRGNEARIKRFFAEGR